MKKVLIFISTYLLIFLLISGITLHVVIIFPSVWHIKFNILDYPLFLLIFIGYIIAISSRSIKAKDFNLLYFVSMILILLLHNAEYQFFNSTYLYFSLFVPGSILLTILSGINMASYTKSLKRIEKIKEGKNKVNVRRNRIIVILIAIISFVAAFLYGYLTTIK